MTDVPVQTFLIDCREASLASHRYTPKKCTKEITINFFKKRKEKNTHPHGKVVLHSRTRTQTQTRYKKHVQFLKCQHSQQHRPLHPKENRAENPQIYTLPLTPKSP